MTDDGRLGPADFQAMGLYDPAAPDRADRLALLEYLTELGATRTDFGLIGPEELPALASLIGLFPEREALTVEETAAATGTSPEFVRRVLVAAGFPDRDPDEPVLFFAPGGFDLFAALSAAFELFGEDATMQFVRVLGAAASRLADAAISLFVVNAAPEAVERDQPLVELARANAAAIDLVPEMVAGFDILLRHHLHASRRFTEVLTVGVEVQPRSIGFVDLVDSTGLSTALEPRALAEAFAAFDATSADIIAAQGGRLVKLIGDEVMFSVADADRAVRIALALIDAFADHDILPPVRAAIASGDVIARDGDYSGPVVNRAARAAKVARPGTLLVDEATRDLASGAGMSYRSVGALSLKGFDRRVTLYRVKPG
jgi:adenylate cyclase